MYLRSMRLVRGGGLYCAGCIGVDCVFMREVSCDSDSTSGLYTED